MNKIPPPENEREQLVRLREALLTLHKSLVDSERISYEQNIGTIPSATHFLRLLTDDPWFAWLHPLSQLIIALDQALDARTPLTKTVADNLVKQTRLLLVATETGETFSRHYFDALQRDPEVIFAHAAAAKIFKANPAGENLTAENVKI